MKSTTELYRERQKNGKTRTIYIPDIVFEKLINYTGGINSASTDNFYPRWKAISEGLDLLIKRDEQKSRSDS